jgi:predicted double-glycine peptidase
MAASKFGFKATKVLLALLSATAILIFIAFNAKAETGPNINTGWVVKQHRNDACVLAAVATNLNYVSGGANYTSAGLALAYKIKYGTDNWAQDGVTSHNAQMLAADAGFKVNYGQLESWGGAAALKYLVWAKRYPVVFLDTYPQHAVTVLALIDDTTLLIGDPWNGTTYQEHLDNFYSELEPQKWYFSTELP